MAVYSGRFSVWLYNGYSLLKLIKLNLLGFFPLVKIFSPLLTQTSKNIQILNFPRKPNSTNMELDMKIAAQLAPQLMFPLH